MTARVATLDDADAVVAWLKKNATKATRDGTTHMGEGIEMGDEKAGLWASATKRSTPLPS